MRSRKLLFAFVALSCLSVAVAALAASEQQVAADANTLHLDYLALEDRVDACPDGACADAAAIRSDLNALKARRTTLHADRATLPGSYNCMGIDSTILAIDLLAGTLQLTVHGWEEQS